MGAVTGVMSAGVKARAAATTVLIDSPGFVKAMPKAKAAFAFVNDLVPPRLRPHSVDELIGITGSDARLNGVSAEAKQIMKVFGQLRDHVEARAATYRVPGTDPSRVALNRGKGLPPADFTKAIRAEIGRRSPAVILEEQAKVRAAFDPELAQALNQSAKTYRGMSTDSRFRAALELKGVELKAVPTGKQLSAADQAAAAASNQRARHAAFGVQAEQEWNNAAAARGWAPELKLKELRTSTEWPQEWPVHNEMAWTKETWVAFRRQQLAERAADEVKRSGNW